MSFGVRPGLTCMKPNDRSRWLALYVLCVGMLMIVLDVTVVNVALPSIQDDLGFSQSSLAWVVNAYLIAFGGLLLLAGRLGDLIGRRSIFLAGIGVFTAASLLCGLAQTQEMLVGARFLQGIGGAMTSAVILGMIVTMFPEPREQAKAIGAYAFVASAGGAVGLLAGGVLTQAVSWHWIFFVNVPIGIATAVFARRLLTHDRGIGLREGADLPGAVLITGALMLAVYTIVIPAAEDGWGASSTLLLGAVSLALLAGFVAREATARTPLVPLRIFRSRNLTGANLIQILSVPAMFGMFFVGALYLQRVLGYDALETGLAFLPVTIIMGTLSVRYTEPLVTRFGARGVLLPGLALIGAGLVLFAQAPVDGVYVTDVLPTMVLLGLGAGLCFPALMTLAMSGATPNDAGLASGLVNTTAQVGGALGLAVLATLSASHTSGLVDRGESAASALTSGYHLAFWVGAALVVAAMIVAAVLLERSPKPRAERSPARAPGLLGRVAGGRQQRVDRRDARCRGEREHGRRLERERRGHALHPDPQALRDPVGVDAQAADEPGTRRWRDLPDGGVRRAPPGAPRRAGCSAMAVPEQRRERRMGAADHQLGRADPLCGCGTWRGGSAAPARASRPRGARCGTGSARAARRRPAARRGSAAARRPGAGSRSSRGPPRARPRRRRSRRARAAPRRARTPRARAARARARARRRRAAGAARSRSRTGSAGRARAGGTARGAGR